MVKHDDKMIRTRGGGRADVDGRDDGSKERHPEKTYGVDRCDTE
jgi:hypothetical protein